MPPPGASTGGDPRSPAACIRFGLARSGWLLDPNSTGPSDPRDHYPDSESAKLVSPIRIAITTLCDIPFVKLCLNISDDLLVLLGTTTFNYDWLAECDVDHFVGIDRT